MAKRRLTPQDQFSWGGTHQFYLHPFLSAFTPDLQGKVIADIGCGKGLNSFLIHTTRSLKGSKLIGIDLNQSFLSFCHHHRLYTKLIRSTLPTIPLPDKSVDFLMCTEVIEHLPHDQGLRLLTEISRVCRGQAIVSTPNVYFDTEPGDYADAHHSLWTSDEFSRNGYKVYGIGFKISLTQQDRFLNLRRALYYIFTPISYLLPSVSATLIAVQDFTKK